MRLRTLTEIAGIIVGLGPKALEWLHRLLDLDGFVHLPSDLSEFAVKIAELPQLLTWGMFFVGVSCLIFLIYDTLRPRRAEQNFDFFAVFRRKLGRSMGPLILIGIGMIVFWIGTAWYALAIRNDEQIVSGTSEPTQEVSAQLRESDISYEDRQFRLDARKFILVECASLFAAFQNAVSQPNIINGQISDPTINRLASNYLNSNGQFMSSWQSMFEYANKDVESIDPAVLSLKLQKALTVYSDEKIVAYLFSATILSKNKAPFEAWQLADNNAQRSFQALQATTSKYLTGMSANRIFDIN